MSSYILFKCCRICFSSPILKCLKLSKDYLPWIYSFTRFDNYQWKNSWYNQYRYLKLKNFVQWHAINDCHNYGRHDLNGCVLIQSINVLTLQNESHTMYFSRHIEVYLYNAKLNQTSRKPQNSSLVTVTSSFHGQ